MDDLQFLETWEIPTGSISICSKRSSPQRLRAYPHPKDETLASSLRTFIMCD